MAQTRSFDVPAQDAASGIPAFAKQARIQIIASARDLRGKRTNAVRGTYPVEQALTLLLRGTDLEIGPDNGTGIITVRPRAPGSPPRTQGDQSDAKAGDASAQSATLGDPHDNSGEIVVTGSRIRGAPVAAPTIKITQEAIYDSGSATLAEAIKDIPQNFGGGQNPGIGVTVPAISGVDVGGGSSINLRGLGSDATLTLLNGHRIAYNGSRQSVDISSIPLGAVDRIEIVPDGASALYGSDAVGGVVNIILKRDLDHVETRARIGGSTDGGNVQQQYALTGGARWSTGGFIAALEYNHASPIEYDDRSYTRSRARGLRLYPSLNNRNVLISGHQRLTDTLGFSIDGLFNERHELFLYSYTPTGDRSVGSQIQTSADRAYALQPELKLTIGSWEAALSGTYARDKVSLGVDVTSGAARSHIADVTYDNSTKAINVAGNGDLLALPGGALKLAIGAGYQSVHLASDRGAASPLSFHHNRESHFAYAELDVPVVAPSMAVVGIERLNFTAAVRHESYEGVGSISTPKLGLIYAPTDAIDLKASWGRSFRAPTMYQRYSPLYVYAYSPATFGGIGYPADATVIYIQGRNEALEPERATTWSLTADFHPPSIPGLTVAIDYFDVRYVDRIVAPITYITESLSDPAYAAQVIRMPSAAQVADLITDASYFTNTTGQPYDPSTVVALIDNRNVNAGRQRVHGVDVITSYRFDLAPSETLTLAGNVAYLESDRRIGPGEPDTPLAGTLYNPPHWRGRATAGWRKRGLMITAAVNYIGAVRDVRADPPPRIGPQTTLDVTIGYSTGDDAPGWLRDLDLSLSFQNLFNSGPPLIATTAPYETPYDSTNYTPIDRFVAFSVAKSW